MMSIRLLDVLAAPLFLVAAFLPGAAAGSDTADDGYERCVNTRLIRSMSVVNDRNIVFNMRGGKIYLNSLPGNCPGLAREKRFSYESHTGVLCKSDRISLINETGIGLQMGRSCRLGQFELVTEQDLVDMFKRPDDPIKTRDVEAPDVEDVIEVEEPQTDDESED